MYKEKGFLTIITKTLRSFTTFFTLILFVRLFIKIISNQYGQKAYGLLFGEVNLTLYAILETAAFSLILAIICLLILSDLFLVKMRFLLRSFLFFAALLSITTVFAVLFDWLDVADPLGWISYFLTFVICFAIGIGIKLLKFSFDGKKYSKLLENYKSKYKTNDHSG